MRHNIDQLGSWAEQWQMAFSLNKCEVMGFGGSYEHRAWVINGRVLGSVDDQSNIAYLSIYP